MMGCGPFAVPVFRALAQSKKHDVVLLVSQPPREIKGRVQPESPMVTTAKELGVPVWTPDRINNHVEELRAYNPDILVVCDFGQILSPPPVGGGQGEAITCVSTCCAPGATYTNSILLPLLI